MDDKRAKVVMRENDDEKHKRNKGSESGDEGAKMITKKHKRDEMDNKGTKVIMRE